MNERLHKTSSSGSTDMDGVLAPLAIETDHERRAALICLLTAALAYEGRAAIIGEAESGWFWLPPWSLWQTWAKQGLESAAKRTALKVTSVLDRQSPVEL